MEATLPQQRRHAPLPNNPLELVVGQVRFPRLPRFAEPGYTIEFEEAIRNRFPKSSREPSVRLVVTDNGMKTEFGDDVLRFTDIDDHYSVIFAPDFIALECHVYSQFEHFSTHFMVVIGLAGDIFNIKHRLRLGLRYINEIRWDKARTYADWLTFLNEEYTGWNPLEKLGGTMLNTIAEFTSKRDDGVFTLRRGFLTGSTLPRKPGYREPNPVEFYLIDLDYSDDRTALLKEDLPDRLWSYHGFIEKIFFEMTENDELQAYFNEARR